MLTRRSLNKIVIGGLVATAVMFGGFHAWVHNASATIGDDPIDVLLASVGGGGEDIISDNTSSATVEDDEGMVFAIGPDKTLLAVGGTGPDDSSLDL
ncbi:MAG: hypothetical protein AAGF95_30655 [Chloroflexota bacterium]